VILVVLAAGRGTRFGGMKQLAAVGPRGETVTDAMLARAAAAGIERAMVVVSPEVESSMREHFRAQSNPIAVDFVVQQAHRGTADALLTARPRVDGTCVVVNADDVYPASAFVTLAHHARNGPADEHAMVAFRADRTLNSDRPGSRALVTRDHDGRLVAITEGRVTADAAGMRFEAPAYTCALRGDELVSMNIWLFRPQFFEDVAAAVQAHPGPGEVYLPDAVARCVGRGGAVRVFATDERCVELTYPDDVALVRDALAP
jgi:bifunctional N-acetylglucosamine-1-phosphate-uridyltransferase/glucosamine-1-phosphate-acetyltransferase GlmU-like protein